MELTATEAVKVRLEEIAEQHAGRLTPEAVVADARNPKSPLHEHFEWDTKKAAAQHWLDTARQLIRSVRVLVRTDDKVISTVAYVRDPSMESNEQGYRSLASLRTDRELARETVVSEFGRAAGVLRRAKEIAKALDMENDVEEIIEMVDAASDKAVAA